MKRVSVGGHRKNQQNTYVAIGTEKLFLQSDCHCQVGNTVHSLGLDVVVIETTLTVAYYTCIDAIVYGQRH